MFAKLSIIFKPETHRILYILLLIATPFLLLQNYLQSAIGELSNLTYVVFNTTIPVTVSIAIILIVTILFFTYKKLNKHRLISWIIVVMLFWIGQKSTDFYFNHKFYELQYNWHYFAYAIFSYLNYRVLSEKNATPQKIIVLTFIYTLAISTFDELMQMPLSNRIFDIGDISKDLWGAMIGLFFIFFILENGEIIKNGWKIRHNKLKEYSNNPLSLLIIEFVFAYVFMIIASLLTSSEYILVAVLISVLLMFLIFAIVHLSQIKVFKTLIILIFAGLIITQGFFIIKFYDKDIIYYNNKLLVYKGIPVFFFDVLIYPDGTFRLVDKKIIFNQRDQQTILELSESIIVIGSGTDGSGGKGFPQNTETQFVFDENTKQGVQITILNNHEACDKFNALKAERKRPVLILHHN